MLMQRILILLFCVVSFCCTGQINTNIFVDGIFSNEVTFEDSLKLKSSIEAKRIGWTQNGYLFNGIDSVQYGNGITYIYLHQGRKSEVEIAGLKRKKMVNALRGSLANYANNGYPFASLQIDSLSLDNEILSGALVVNKGPEIRYDSAFFFDEIKTNERYVYQLLDFVPEELFNESNYTKLASRIKRSPFLTLARPTDISFSANKAKVYLDLEEETTNSFQGILGLQQKPSGGTSVVGSLDLSMQNLFRSGHEFQFYWESFAESSQRLDLFYKHAFLFQAKVSPSFRFGLLKQDTTFLTRTTAIGINTFIASNISMLLEYEGSNGSLISSNAQELQSRNLADFQRNFYKMEVSSGFLETLNSFQQGFVWKFSVGIGKKEIQKNVALPDSYYDTIALKTDFIRFEGRVAYQLKVAKRQSIYHDLSIGILRNQEILTNELYRLGGLSTLRGFNEKNFFASQFALSRLEFRSFFENRSFIYVFYDQLIFERSNYFDYPVGIGLGFALETSSGQFTFALASGNSKNQNISFSDLRAHFGFITKF